MIKKIFLILILTCVAHAMHAHKIITTGAPKSGINMLVTIIEQILDINKHGTIDGDMVLDEMQMRQLGTQFQLLVGTPIHDEHNVQMVNTYHAKVIYIVRDPRDQIASSARTIYAYRSHIPAAKNKTMHALIQELITNGSALYAYQYPFKRLHTIKGIRELYDLWLPWQDEENVLVVRFEALAGAHGQSKQVQEIQKIASFIGIPCSNNKAQTIIQHMTGGFFGLFKKKPTVGSYQKLFTPQHKQTFKHKAQDLLRTLNYETHDGW